MKAMPNKFHVPVHRLGMLFRWALDLYLGVGFAKQGRGRPQNNYRAELNRSPFLSSCP